MQNMMDTMDIAFPHLGIYLRNVPKTITIGNFSIALYGIVIAIGMLCGIWLASRIAKKTGQNPDTYWDISIWLIIFSIIGARVYYVIFFWDAYKDDPIQIFNLRGGGLAIYGGVIAGVITAIVYCHRKKLRPLVVLDTACFGLILGQIIGRWANFFNREVFGGYTDNLLAMRLPIAMVRERDITPELASHIQAGTNYIQVHPTFLYESLWNLMILCIMLWYRKRKKFDGEMMLLVHPHGSALHHGDEDPGLHAARHCDARRLRHPGHLRTKQGEEAEGGRCFPHSPLDADSSAGDRKQERRQKDKGKGRGSRRSLRL